MSLPPIWLSSFRMPCFPQGSVILTWAASGDPGFVEVDLGVAEVASYSFMKLVMCKLRDEYGSEHCTPLRIKRVVIFTTDIHCSCHAWRWRLLKSVCFDALKTKHSRFSREKSMMARKKREGGLSEDGTNMTYALS
ncbi:hypothetical protein EJB05_26599, partial [Eragrostis curvula]